MSRNYSPSIASNGEQDPLLPRDDSAPEIHGSRPQSINDVGNYDRDAFDAYDEKPKRSISSYCFLTAFSLLVIWIVLPELANFIRDSGPHRVPTSRNIDERVNSILTQTPLIDGHNDLAISVRVLYNNHINQPNFTQPFTEGGMQGHVDLPRLRKGKVGGAFWAAFVPCPANGTDFSDANYVTSVQFTYNQIDLLKRLQVQYPESFSVPVNSSTALSVFKNGQLVSPLAIEGLHQIGNSLSTLRNYFELGVRYATLTHNCHNQYADAALLETATGGVIVAPPRWNGVSPAGRALIHEMNRLGMIVDLAHVSHATMKDVLGAGSTDWAGSKAPPIFSHSSAYALCPHPRNVRDDVLQLVKLRNSIVMVNFSPGFISCVEDPAGSGVPVEFPPNATLAHVVNHIVYIGDLIGYDHVGFGSDFDGIPSVPAGLDDVSRFPDLVAELLHRGVSDEDAAKVVGGNLLRVWREIDRVALELQAAGEVPLEDDLPGFI